MSEYTFIGASLPDLAIGLPPEIDFDEFTELLRENMSASDLKKSQVMRTFWDLQNLRSFWKGEPDLDMHGNYNENELDQAVVNAIGFPDYVYRFLEANDTPKERIDAFSSLIATYFEKESERAQGFLKEYLQFEREWRLVFTGFRAKALGRDLASELQYENPEDDLIQQMMAQKDAAHFEPPDRYQELKALFEEHAENPIELHQALTEWRFNKVQKMGGMYPFSLDRILSYQARLMLVERWMALDEQKGKQFVKEMQLGGV